MGARRGRRKRTVPVRARRGHAFLRSARLAGSGIPLHVGGIAPLEADDAARLAVEPDRPPVSETQAGGVPAVFGDSDADAQLGRGTTRKGAAGGDVPAFRALP